MHKGSITAIGATLLAAVSFSMSKPARAEGTSPILVLGVREPEEMRVKPVVSEHYEPTAAERELAQATANFSKLDDPSVRAALDKILTEHPDFSDGYLFRLGQRCAQNDLAGAIADVDHALQFIENSRTKQTLGLRSMRAKMKLASGDDAGALSDLDNAVRANLERAREFTNSGGIKPETAPSICTWTLSDMDRLTARFPSDYRSHMLRGLYFTFFATWDEGSEQPAIESLNRAMQLNPKTALPQLFKAELLSNFLVFNKRLNRLGWRDDERDKLDREVANEYSKAIALDPNLLPALKGRANAYLHLKQYRQAIGDYDRIVTISPQEAGSFHDRGLAKMLSGRTFDAISDFKSYINLKSKAATIEGRGDLAHGHESLGDAYVKVGEWGSAANDFTQAISLELGNAILLMSIEQFRAMYPEYGSASNELVARKLQQTFFPDLGYDNFVKDFFSRPFMPSTTIPDLILKRSDAYLKMGYWHKAAIDFQRATKGFPEYANALDRWRGIDKADPSSAYVDLKTFDDAKRGSVRVWMKFVRAGADATSDYALQRYEVNCIAAQMRLVSLANYSAGAVVSQQDRPNSQWTSALPDTVGETIYNGACRAN